MTEQRRPLNVPDSGMEKKSQTNVNTHRVVTNAMRPQQPQQPQQPPPQKK